MSDTHEVSIGELDTEEPACEEETQALLEEDVVVSAEEEAELERWFEETESDEQEEGTAPGGLGPMGGRFGGTVKPGKRAMRIAARNGLTITSTKRSTGSRTSDHHISQTTSYAVDMSNGSSPTPQMDRACHQIAKRLGHPEFRAGNLVVNIHHGYRVQLLYRTNIGGNHFNHVHVGMRRL
jgi:hypothetical protein